MSFLKSLFGVDKKGQTDDASIYDIADIGKQAPKFRKMYDDGKFDQVIAKLAPLLPNLPESSELRKILSSVYSDRGGTRHLKGDPSGALEDFEAAVNANPQNFHALWNCGQLYKVQGRSTEAMLMVAKAYQIDPARAEKLSKL